jgi:hypothetical protein
MKHPVMDKNKLFVNKTRVMLPIIFFQNTDKRLYPYGHAHLYKSFYSKFVNDAKKNKILKTKLKLHLNDLI